MGKRAEVIRRPMVARLLAEGVAALDAVAEPGETGRFRVFLAAGTDRALLAPLPGPDCAQALEAREVSGGILYDARGVTRLALAEGAVDVAPTPHERDLLIGRNVLLGFRLEEPAETVADWIGWHVAQHGADGALVVNRAPPETGHDRFAEGLAAALDALGVAARVVVVEPDVPLGKPGIGPETHPFLAPDAPGKDRMTPPDPDPWLAPLGEGLVLEVLNLRRSICALRPGKAWCSWSGIASIRGGCARASARGSATTFAASSTPAAAWRAGVWRRTRRGWKTPGADRAWLM
ncbi:MAG: hypothetical protein MUC82_17445 [Cypionkella sp.]|nr:hypothetical protein [Cypionkella sp.]